MNEVKRCSLSGIAFTLDIEAYDALHNYIQALKQTYGSEPDGDEIVADIEARIAELILSTQDNARVVGTPLILNIIDRMGSAEDINEESNTGDSDKALHEQQAEPRIPRRLYRDLGNARLGGVCSGIARYFNVDTSMIRLIACSPLLMLAFSIIPFIGNWLSDLGWSLCGVVFVCYLIMWFVVPAARTPRQKLEMNGEKITVRSIRDNAAATKDIDSRARSTVAETVTVLGKVLIIALKVTAAVIIFGLMIFAIALLTGLFVVLFTDLAVGKFGIPGEVLMAANLEKLIPALAIVVCLLPVVLLLYILISLLVGRKTNRVALLVVFLLWIASIIALPVAAVKGLDIHANYSFERSDRTEEHQRILDSIASAAAQQRLDYDDEDDTALQYSGGGSADNSRSIDLD